MTIDACLTSYFILKSRSFLLLQALFCESQVCPKTSINTWHLDIKLVSKKWGQIMLRYLYFTCDKMMLEKYGLCAN